MKIKSLFQLLACIVLCQAVGGIGAIFTYPEISGWYTTLQKPGFNPPDWIFGPVWTTLFCLMGVSLWLILKSEAESRLKKIAVVIFFIQLGLNSLWSLLFFKMHSPLAALVEVAVLWFSILFWIIKTYPVSKIAAVLTYPYLLWVSFASLLNFWLWKLNG